MLMNSGNGSVNMDEFDIGHRGDFIEERPLIVREDEDRLIQRIVWLTSAYGDMVVGELRHCYAVKVVE